MLVPATAEDLKKHGQISIITKTQEQSLVAGNVDQAAESNEILMRI